MSDFWLHNLSDFGQKYVPMPGIIPVESGVLKIADLHRQIAIFENISPTIGKKIALCNYELFTVTLYYDQKLAYIFMTDTNSILAKISSVSQFSVRTESR